MGNRDLKLLAASAETVNPLVTVRFEPDRFADKALADAYEQLLPLLRRSDRSTPRRDVNTDTGTVANGENAGKMKTRRRCA